MGRSRIWRTRRAKVRRGRYRRWRGARQAWPVPQPTRANPNRASWSAGRHERYLVETREHGQVVTRNGDQGDECAEQQDVGDWNAGKRRRARTPKREALQVAP